MSKAKTVVTTKTISEGKGNRGMVEIVTHYTDAKGVKQSQTRHVKQADLKRLTKHFESVGHAEPITSDELVAGLDKPKGVTAEDLTKAINKTIAGAAERLSQ